MPETPDEKGYTVKNKTTTTEMDAREKKLMKVFEKYLEQNKGKDGALIPILQQAQTLFGYLPGPVLKRISLAMNKPYSEVAGVANFYSFFSIVPRGRHLIRVCLGTACYVRGGKKVLEALRKHLKIDVGQTTPDRRFSLEVARCFGACGLAPAIMVDDTVHQRVKAARIHEILNEYK